MQQEKPDDDKFVSLTCVLRQAADERGIFLVTAASARAETTRRKPRLRERTVGIMVVHSNVRLLLLLVE